jgi:HAD superfamily hydrolase (TIGR01509 family)
VIELVVFDFDGLILDTELPVFRCWQEIYADHGCELPFDLWADCIGTADTFDPVVDLTARVGRPLDGAALDALHRVRTDELIAAETIRPGVLDYLEAARALGVKLAVASSSSRAWVAGHLERLGVLERFEVLKCADDVARVKPDPALYRAACEHLGVPPARAVAIEDSPNGILAAKRAGLFCVAVPNALTGRLALDAADLRLASLSELPLAELLTLAGRQR